MMSFSNNVVLLGYDIVLLMFYHLFFLNKKIFRKKIKTKR